MSAPHFAALRRRLLGWYDKNKRDFPWRRTSDPYAIWISETMLQQTQVATVIPYFERFMKEFPDPRALHRAPLARVLALWSGLGYYRRAENLKKSARLMVRRHGGRVPDDYRKLRALPGIGDYTAGAVLSIAFGRNYPAVDGNARRVLFRLFEPSDAKQVSDIARKLMPRSRCGEFNQSLMDLGRTLCAPRKPRCSGCPVEELCASRRNGQLANLRRLKQNRLSRAVIWPIAIVRSGGKLLLRRRAAGKLLGGLWELPGGEKAPRGTILKTLAMHLRQVSVSPVGGLRLGRFRHGITTRRIAAPVYLFVVAPDRRPLPNAHWRWVAPAALGRYATSSMTRKALTLLVKHEESDP